MSKKTRFAIGILLLAAVFSFGAVKVYDGAIYRDVVTFLKGVTFKGNVNIAGTIKTSVGNGAVVSGATVVEYGDGIVHKSVFTFNKSITLTDTSGAGTCGSFKFYDLPEGAIEILGVVVDLDGSSASGSTHGLNADADGDFAIGTAACNVGALASTEADVVASTEIAQFATTMGPIHGQNAAVTYFDGTGTAKDLYLNVIFDDADSSGNDTLLVTGTVTVYWINRGDY